MNENNLYSIENYASYTQPVQYAKQPQTKEAQTYFSYSPALLNNFSPNTNYGNICTSISTQSIRNQNNYVNYQDPVDISNWENRAVPDLEKVMKFPDKIEMIEITSKDLSPASYCSNIDLLVPELYKPTSKDSNICNKYDNQYYYSQATVNQKPYEYPSCVQYEKPVRYSVQKNYEEPSYKSCSYNSDGIFVDNEIISKTIGYNYADYNICNYYEKVQEHQLPIQSDLFNNTNIQFDPIINPIDQQTEDSNEDSDIIVEESDDEISYEDQDKRYSKLNKCLICNLIYTPFGIQFYFLTSKSPLTMSSQKPVLDKIVDLVGKIATTKNYLCSECLGLLNTIDHLQLKVDTFNTEFIAKYKKTCIENQTEYENLVNKKIKRKVPKNIRYKCKICKKVLCVRSYFLYHLNRHKKPGLLCEFCGIMFSRTKKFLFHHKRHNRQNNTGKIEPYKCTNCVKMFRTKSQLKCHENYCLGLLPFDCKHHNCDKKFATSTQLKNHIKLKHDKKFIAICSICNIGFVKMADYKNHKITHSTDKKYSCTKCENSYKTLSNLRFHMKVHNKELPYTCPICKKGFMRKEYHEAHVNNHNGIKKYGCSICKKHFSSQKNLDSHLKSHEDSKKLSCNVCGKTMLNSFKLKEHLRVHNNLKEFDCEKCDLKFNTRGTLQKHLKKKHSSDKD